MKRRMIALAVLGAVGAVVVAVWLVCTGSNASTGQESLNEVVESLITNPVGFAEAHFTGGIGVAVSPDSKGNVPVIRAISAGSPAEAAGLREGDLILKVDGVATSGRTMSQNVESIRGFAGGSVRLNVQRSGSTNLEFVVSRISWKRMGISE